MENLKKPCRHEIKEKINDTSLERLNNTIRSADMLADDIGLEDKYHAAQFFFAGIQRFLTDHEITPPDILQMLIEDLDRRSAGEEPWFFKSKDKSYYAEHGLKFHAALAVEYFRLSGMKVEPACKEVVKSIGKNRIKQINRSGRDKERPGWKTVHRWREDIKGGKYDNDADANFVPSNAFSFELMGLRALKNNPEYRGKEIPKDDYKKMAEQELAYIKRHIGSGSDLVIGRRLPPWL